MDLVTPSILEATESIDFGCGFVDGKCVAVDKRIARRLRPLNPICCRSCHHYVGYLRVREDDLPSAYKPYFKPVTGFLTETGCGLPREMRSRRCVLYVCRDADTDESDRVMLRTLEAGQ